MQRRPAPPRRSPTRRSADAGERSAAGRSSRTAIRIVRTSCRERLGRSAAHEGPERQRRLAVSTAARRSRSPTATPIRTATASFEEPLPAGTYSGAATTSERDHRRQQGRLQRRARPDFVPDQHARRLPVQAAGTATAACRRIVDIFNVTNRANFNNPTGDRRDAATFLILRSIRNGGPSRTAQFNVRYRLLGRRGQVRYPTGSRRRRGRIPYPTPPPASPAHRSYTTAHAHAARPAVPSLLLATMLSAQPPAAFQLEETTIAQIQTAFRDGSLTCRSLVEQYLKRIDAHDKRGAALNAIVHDERPSALKTADDLDRRFRQSGPVGPMHCVPVLVKDNYETVDMPTTAGSLSLQGHDDRQGRVRRQAAARRRGGDDRQVEHGGVRVQSRSKPSTRFCPATRAIRTTRAASRPDRAAARRPAPRRTLRRSALASDTGDSIRGPAAHQALVGLRSTMGLVSRGGVVPLNLAADIAGAVTRTVADTAAVLQVIAGEDPNDPATAASRGRVDANYAAALRRDGLKGARLGVLHQAYDTPTLDKEVDGVFRGALGELRNLGAEVIDPVAVDGLDALRRDAGRRLQPVQVRPQPFPRGALGDKAPMHSLEEIIKSRRFHPSIQARLESSQASEDVPGETAGCKARDEFREKLRAAVLDADDRPAARRADLSDLEQPAASHRRPQHAGRRQQPVLLAEHRVPGDYRADGIHARRYPARRPAVLRPAVERGDASPPGVRVRAGHAPSAAACCDKLAIR